MNFAFPAAILILGLLPGIAFFSGYFSGRFARSLAGVSPTSEVAQWIALSLPLNVLGRSYAEVVFGLNVRVESLLGVLSGAPTSAQVSSLADSVAGTNLLSVTAYVSFILLCLGGGSAIRRVVWAFRLDLKVPLLRLRHSWFYTLTGRLAGVPRGAQPYGDFMVRTAGDAALYRGLVLAVEVSDSGDLQQVTLANAQRGKGRGTAFRWRDIPGHRFSINGKDIQSINMQYVVMEQDVVPLRKSQAARRSLGKFWRALVHEEN